jgi:FAD/FMN-containing dehydrogenase
LRPARNCAVPVVVGFRSKAGIDPDVTKPLSRRAFLESAAAAGALAACPAAAQPAPGSLVLDDASCMNAVPVARHWTPSARIGGAWIDELRAELKAAAREGRPVAVGAARHSMGGQALPRNGLAITADVKVPDGDWLAPDPSRRIYRVAAGARWSQVIAALDPVGFSPAVMQSNNDFGVAGTLSVNAHGWPVPYGSFGATVRSFRLMLASGDLVSCSATENPDLFASAIGGYGVFGVIVDADLEMVENRRLKPTFAVMPADAFGGQFVDAIEQDTDVRMAYGRLAVHAGAFLRESVLVTYRAVPGAPQSVRSGGLVTAIARDIFRAQTGSDADKRKRWHIETVIGPAAAAAAVSRNRLLNEPVASLASRDRSRTDILHEYFLPPEGLENFLAAARRIIPASRQDLLNVTLRYLPEDRVSVLAYARGKRVAAVMLFSQAMTGADEEDMRVLSERLIDAALDSGGSFYLPYRLHARPDQLARAYPRLGEFVGLKHRYDPQLLFRNFIWDRYFG